MSDERYTLYAGTVLYHGSPEPYATSISKTKRLTGRPAQKLGGGTLDEGGLIWFARTPELALQWAHGREARPWEYTGRGRVFRYMLDRDLVIVSRGKKLTSTEARLLNRVLGIPSYKSVRTGDMLSIAVSRAFDSSKREWETYRTQRGTMRVIWPLALMAVNAHGFYYPSTGETIAIAAEALDVDLAGLGGWC